MMAVFLLAGLLGCARLAPHQPANPSGLPALPSGVFDSRNLSALEVRHLDGADAVQKSTGAVAAGSDLVITAVGGNPTLEWAIWKYTPASNETLLSASIDMELDGNSAWIGVADYGNNRWKLQGPYPTAGTADIASLGAGNVSPNGNAYLLVASYSGTTTTVHGIDVDVDAVAPSTFVVAGEVKDSVTNLGIVGAVMLLNPGNIQATTVVEGSFVFTDLPANTYTITAPTVDGYDVTPSTVQVTVGPNALDANFTATAQTTAVTYTNRIKAIMDNRCVVCHGPDRADDGVRLDSYLRPDSNDVFHHAEDSYAQVATDFMPPGGPALPILEVQSIEEWINDWAKAE
ncbi:MAG: carboxypeptidase-like regulatory domain-containing protein [bacterium]|nr:carboxypeptidase-like regulatory domain-containing protein [bacterium]